MIVYIFRLRLKEEIVDVLVIMKCRLQTSKIRALSTIRQQLKAASKWGY